MSMIFLTVTTMFQEKFFFTFTPHPHGPVMKEEKHLAIDF